MFTCFPPPRQTQPLTQPFWSVVHSFNTTAKCLLGAKNWAERLTYYTTLLTHLSCTFSISSKTLNPTTKHPPCLSFLEMTMLSHTKSQKPLVFFSHDYITNLCVIAHLPPTDCSARLTSPLVSKLMTYTTLPSLGSHYLRNPSFSLSSKFNPQATNIL